ncbi:hypothetical protein SASPL_107210 [Salvia splendens]|uniref:Protease Do-like 2, chloroplastic n=1 Tax=Salvia splendens TaxID=180675 RepID=A0A8X9A481_SALSN|nr:hypothetical protein SASPL_107210 [Salvia splendens]
MSLAAASCWLSALSLTSNSRRSAPHSFIVFKSSHHPNHYPIRGKTTKLLPKSAPENEAKLLKFQQSQSDEYPHSNAGGRSTKTTTGRTQPSSPTSFGIQKKKGKKDNVVDSVEKQVETGNLQGAAFLNAVVKVYCTHTAPDYSLPWQKQRQYASTGSAFMIGEGKILTNAHCVEHDTQVKVKRRGDDTKYVAKVLARGVECDLALLSVESKEFWEGAEPIQLGNLPNLQDAVTVVGYPLGGETISVSKGVISRIEVTSYAHGSSELLGIQIDAAINPGNSGGPAFNDQGECIGVAFQWIFPLGFPCLGVLLQKLENPALRACLNVPTNEGVLVRKVEPTSPASHVLKEGDVIVSFGNIRVGCEGTVPFRSTERIAFRYLISQKFSGDEAELGIVRGGQSMKVQVLLIPRVHLVPYHIEGDQPSYLIIAGLVFTSLSQPLIEEECEDDSIGMKLLAKARYSMARFKGEQIVILSQLQQCLQMKKTLDMKKYAMSRQVLKLNGTWIKNIHHLAHLVDSCKDKYLVFEFEDNFLVVLERESAQVASPSILKAYGIPSQRSADLMEPYLDSVGQNEATDQHEFGDSPISSSEFGYEGLLWA